MIALREREEHDKISKMGEIVILLVKASLNDAGLISRKNENIFFGKRLLFWLQLWGQGRLLLVDLDQRHLLLYWPSTLVRPWPWSRRWTTGSTQKSHMYRILPCMCFIFFLGGGGCSLHLLQLKSSMSWHLNFVFLTRARLRLFILKHPWEKANLPTCSKWTNIMQTFYLPSTCSCARFT